MNLWKRKTKSTYSDRIIGYKYSATGVFGYAFFHDHDKICTVTSIVVPSPPVLIEGYGRKWSSAFDEGSTIVPGLTRYVHDVASHAQVARLVYRDCDEYEIGKSVTARCGDGAYSFFHNGKIVAQIDRYKGENAWVPVSMEYDYEPHFEAHLKDELDDTLKLLIFSFPMLRFGL